MVIYCRRPLSTHIHVFLMGKSVKKTVPRLSWSGVTVSDASLPNQFLVMTLLYACPSKPGLLCAANLSWKHHTSCRYLATFLSPSGVCVESDPTEVTVSRNLTAQNPCGILWIIWVCLGFNLVFISSAFQLHKIIIIIALGSSCFHLKFLAHARKGRLRAWIIFFILKDTLKFAKVILLALFTFLRDIGCSLKFINSSKSDSVFGAGPDLCTMCELLLLEFIIGCVRH